MTVDHKELRVIPRVTIPESLEWDYFAQNFLTEVNPLFHGNIEFVFKDIATRGHAGQVRESGEPFFSHPLMATIYLIQAGCTHDPHIMACLMHDVPEDNLPYLIAAGDKIFQDITGIQPYPLNKRLIDEAAENFDLISKQFGMETSEIVEAITKLQSTARSPRGKKREEKVYQEILSEGPPGGWVVKAADRLHNLRTLPLDNKERVRRKIKETENGYLPIFTKAEIWFPEAGILNRHIREELELLKKAA